MTSMKDFHFDLADLKKIGRKKSKEKIFISYKEKENMTAEEDGRTSSFGVLVTDAMSNTGMQGLPNVQRSRNVFRKTFWTCICFAGIAVMSWQISLAVMKYYTYPTSTTVGFEYKTSLEFPAITICNNNAIKNSLLRTSQSADALKKYVEKTQVTWDDEINENTTAPPSLYDWYDDTASYEDPLPDTEEDYTDSSEDTVDEVWYEGEEDSSFDFVEDFISLASKINRTERTKLGHQLATMFISCTWQGKKCRARQFSGFNNYMYGNCYTFNSGRATGNRSRTKTLKTDKIGPLYGFALELYIEQSEYIEGFADSAGVRVIIHNQTTMPFPEDYGISLKPGSKTSIGITRKDTSRATAPHGSCIDYTKRQNLERNAFIADIETVTYSVPACRKTCYQKALMEKCSCYDYKVPADANIKAYKNLSASQPLRKMSPCYENNVFLAKKPCIKNVTAAFVDKTLGCNALCHVPCYQVEYPYTISYSQWPSMASETRVLDILSSKSPEFWELVYSEEHDDVWKKQWLNDNFLKMEVYFSDLNYEVVNTFPSYDAINLISDLGGQAGLWLGVSVIAFFELFELILDLSILFIKHMQRKQAAKTAVNKLVPEDGEEISRPHSRTAFGSSDSIQRNSPSLSRLSTAKISVHEL